MDSIENAPLSAHTTFRLGGAARFLVRAHTLDDITEALAYAKEKKLRTLILGGGSNMLVADEGFDGLVIKIELTGISFVQQEGGVAHAHAAAGESWDALVAGAAARGLWGVENLSGIPGTVGAAPVQNIGAYGSELKDTLVSVDALDIETDTIVSFPREACEFGYRTSLFKRSPGRYIILQVVLELSLSSEPKLSYRDLAEHFKDRRPLSPQEVRDAVCMIRGKKFPDLSREGTAGSFFLNPIVSAEHALALRARYPELPQYPAEQGVKISLAWLLDHVLNARGKAHGGARLFERQPIVIVARPDATTRDVLVLAEQVIEEVAHAFAITLEKEVQYIK